MDSESPSPVSEVVNEDWQFDVVRTYVLGVEILDMRLSDGEFRLLSLMRLRASGGRNNFVSHATLAKDLNTSEKTISRAMSNLKRNGYITCKSRGFSAPTLKTITSMVERYDDDILKMSRKDILSSGRDDDLLRRLHHLDEAADGPSGTKMSTPDSIEEKGVHTGQKCPLIQDKSVPSEGTKMSTEVNKANVNQGELDSARSARDAPVNQKEDLRRTEEVVLPTLISGRESRPEKLDDRDADLRRAQESAVQVAARAAMKSQEALEKSAERKTREDKFGTAAERSRLREQARLENKTAGGKFYDWALEEYVRFFPKIRMGKWMAPQFSQLKQLIAAYDGDEALVRKAWSYSCENWEELTKKLKIADSAPTIGFLLGFRERIFPLIQSQKSDRQAIERQPVKTKIGEW